MQTTYERINNKKVEDTSSDWWLFVKWRDWLKEESTPYRPTERAAILSIIQQIKLLVNHEEIGNL